eukprot:1366544-Ditylum_brightwellii.AAC.1
MIAGACREDGTCTDAIVRTDGTPCNSVPFGVCQSGNCSAQPTSSPTHQPTRSPSTTGGPTKAPTKPPTASPTKAP